MITRKSMLLATAVGAALLLTGCTTRGADGTYNPGVPSTSASAGVKSAPTSTATPAAPTDTGSAQAGDVDTSAGGDITAPTTGGDDQRAATLVVMSYFDNLLVGDAAKAQRLLESKSSNSEQFAAQIVKEKLLSYRISGQAQDTRNGYTVVRVHYSTQANPADRTRDFAAEEDQLESLWQIADVDSHAFSETSP
jgi:hypothetical protein